MKKNFIRCILCSLAVSVLLASCNKQQQPTENDRPIVIIYDNDVHCAVDGYPKIAGLRDAIAAADTAYVALVSSGDFIQGGMVGSLSRGADIIPILNAAKYDVVTLGNHEFDYGVPRMMEVLSHLNSEIVCVNFRSIDKLQPYYAPYTIKKMGKKKIAFVGVLTPETLHIESSSFFDDKGKQLYDICNEGLVALVQESVNKARSEGADYVVALAHLGEVGKSLTSVDLINKTTGIDVVLDGHSHSVIECNMVPDVDQKLKPSTQTGTAVVNVGKLHISKDGKCTTTLIPAESISFQSASVADAVTQAKKKFEEFTSRVCAQSDCKLSINDENGKRIVRKQEAGIGDFFSDVVAALADVEISIVNGGNLRADLPQGTVTNGDIINVIPFDNQLCLLELTGKQLLDFLESCLSLLPEENGSFPQVCGIKLDVDINASPRIKSSQVLVGGQWSAIAPDGRYKVVASDYILTLMPVKPTVLNSSLGIAYMVVPDVIKNKFDAHIDAKYKNPQGRITIK